jgi:hypothetical protein
MRAEEQERLRALLKTFDEVGLVALANKGLVRRAMKDLESATMRVEETDTAFLVRGPDFTVTMPADGPAKAKDDTKASGMTRQILMATIYLRDTWAGAAAPTAETAPLNLDALETALLELTHEHLQKWAGKNIWRDALLIAEMKPSIEVEVGVGFSIRFVDHEIEARILPGETTPAKLLDGILTTASKTSHARWVVATVLAFHQHKGKSIERPDTSILVEADDTPQTRGEVLHAVQHLLGTMIAMGLAHPSERLHERLLTLSMSALGIRCPRLSRQLRALADEITLLLNRDVKADSARLLDRLAVAYALTRAMVQAGDTLPLTLAGRPRTEYEPVGDLSLVGVAAYPWQTASGFRGLTLLLWDERARAFRSWSTSRAVQGGGRFDLRQAYATDAVWAGGGAPEYLCRERIVLRNARMNFQGRLSASQGVSVANTELARPLELDFASLGFRSWTKLGEYARGIYPLGLREPNPLDSIVVLTPSAWGATVFDEFQQRLLWNISDEEGRSLTLAVPWDDVHEDTIVFLEQVNPERDRLRAVVARLSFESKGLIVEPLALWSEGTSKKDYLLNPAFDLRRIQSKHSTLLERLRAKYGRNALKATMRAEDEDADWLVPALAFPTELENRFADLEGMLAGWAERGVGGVRDSDRERVRALTHQYSLLGMSALLDPLAALETSGNELAVLWLAYLLRTYRQAYYADHVLSSGLRAQ